MQYRRITEGLNDRGTLIPSDADVYSYIKNPEKDYYLSTFKYTEEQKSLFEETGTVAGITDVTTDKLWWDFDSEFDPDAAKKNCFKLVNDLLNLHVDRKDI